MLTIFFFFLWCLLYTGDLHTLLDMAKVADTILFLLDPLEGWDSTGDYCLSCLFAQGLPTYSKCAVLDTSKENSSGLVMQAQCLRLSLGVNQWVVFCWCGLYLVNIFIYFTLFIYLFI